MEFTSEQELDDGVVERAFTLGDVPGVVWTPASVSAPAPLVLVGHPGGLLRMQPRLAARSRSWTTEHGYAAAAIELPGSGERPRVPALEQARADLREAVAAGRPVGGVLVDAGPAPVGRRGQRPSGRAGPVRRVRLAREDAARQPRRAHRRPVVRAGGGGPVLRPALRLIGEVVRRGDHVRSRTGPSGRAPPARRRRSSWR